MASCHFYGPHDGLVRWFACIWMCWTFFWIALFVLGDTCHGQNLVPVTNRKAVSWGSSGGELPIPINPQQEEGDLSTIEDPSIGELPILPERPARRSEVIVQRYPDGKPHVTRRVMQDREGNFLNNGPWKLFSPAGEIMAEGNFRQGMMDGRWRRWHPANSPGIFSEAPFDLYQGPFLSVATFNQGKLDGIWTIYDSQRRKILALPYRNGQRHGRVFWYFPNGSPMRELDFREGQLNGQLNEYDQRGQPTRQTNFVDGQELIRRTEFYFKDQKKSESNFLGPTARYATDDDWWNAVPAQFETVGQELQHGPVREWHPNGQIRLSGQYQQGVRVGLFRWWHSNGRKQIEGQFKNGQKVNLWTWYHANGQRAIQGSYLADQETGTWRWWDENGELEDKQEFGLDSLESIEGDENDSAESKTTSAPLGNR